MNIRPEPMAVRMGMAGGAIKPPNPREWSAPDRFTGADQVVFSGKAKANKAKASKNMHWIDDIALKNPNGTYNMVVEIPAGTNDKWETRKDSGRLYLPKVNGKNRQVDFLPYPGNYGFIPQTLSDPALGGDGDALDVLLLAPKVSRKKPLPVRVIGALYFIDKGAMDDKLLAVPATGPFSDVHDLPDLQQRYPGALEILKIWFENYAGPGVKQCKGFADRKQAEALITEAHQSWLAKGSH